MNLKENQELMEKVKKSGSFSNKMNQISQKFKELQQIAFYSEAYTLSKDMVITIHREQTSKWEGKTSQPINLHVIIGMKQPNGPKSIEKILLNIINTIPRPTQSYSVLYVNTLSTSAAYADFKKIMEFLPIQYFKHLEKIYVLHANLKNKGSYWMSFDYITNYLKSKTVQVDNYKQLVDKIGVNREAFLYVLPEQIVAELSNKDQFVRQMVEMKIVKANIIFNSNVYDPLQGNYINKKSIVKAPSITKAPTTKTLQEYEVGQTGAPLIIELLIYYFNGKEELLNQQGLFRKSVGIDDETNLLKQLYAENYDYLESITDPHLIANGIKRFLTNLAEPVIPYSSFNKLMDINEEAFNECVLQTVLSLKNNRKMTILLLIDFLKEKMLPRSQFNKMTQNNLSIILGPCLMHSEVPSMKDLIFTKRSINAAAIIFKDFQKIFGNTHQRMILIRKSIKIQGRQTFKERLQDPIEPLSEQNEKAMSKAYENQAKNTEDNKLLSGIFQIMKQGIDYQQKLEKQANFDQQEEIFYQIQPTIQK